MTDLSDLETEWTRKLRLGERPSPAELRDHLLTVHRVNTGFTESCAGRARDAHGRTSYEWLAELIDPVRHRRVLDLACGSGPLLSICERRFRSQVALIGVDMSPDELALAKARLPNSRVEMRQSLAQDLSWLPDGSVDAVLCHWALTLMDPVGPVLAEVHRILRPGGVFAAVVDGDMTAVPGYASIHRLIYDRARRELERYGEYALGDPRVRDARKLALLAEEVFGPSCRARIEPGMVRLEGSPRELAREAAGFFYASFVLPADAHAAMLAALEALLADRARGAAASFEMPIARLVVARRTTVDMTTAQRAEVNGVPSDH